MPEIVWSIVTLVAIAMGGAVYTVYWLLTYDDRNPN
jgi:hypothetical protein